MHCTQYNDAICSYKRVEKRQLCSCSLTLLRTKELKGDEWASKSTATEIAYTVCASDSCSTMLFYRCFQWRCQCRCDKKVKLRLANVLVVQIKSPPARSASGVITRWCGVLLFACMSVRGGERLLCRSLLVIVFVVIYCCRRLRHVHLRHNDDVSFGVIVHRQCKSRFNRCLQCTLDCLQCTLINKSALQTTRVHCRQRSQRSVTDIPGE